MHGFYAGLGPLLIWGIFQPATMSGYPGECPKPRKIEFAEYTAPEGYVVGTHARYICHQGYRRKQGESTLLKCTNKTGAVNWHRISPLPICVVDLRWTPLAQPKARQWTLKSTSPQLTNRAGFCEAPKSISNANAKVTMYHVGQKLLYECLEGYRGNPPISEVSACEASGEGNVWSDLNLNCTKDPGESKNGINGFFMKDGQ